MLTVLANSCSLVYFMSIYKRKSSADVSSRNIALIFEIRGKVHGKIGSSPQFVNIYRLDLGVHCQFFFLYMLTRFPYLHFSLSHHQQFMYLSSLCVRMEKFQTIFHLLQSNLGSHQLSV